MAGDLRKCISLGPAGLQPNSIFSYWNQRQHIAESVSGYSTRTKWVRFWADWSVLQDREDYTEFNQQPKWFDLDDQIRRAIQDGMAVIVTAYRFPTWANRNRRASLGIAENHPYATFVVPDELGYWYPGTQTRTPWSTFIEHLFIRYNPGNPGNGGGYAHCVEVMNEPNIQFLPQSGVHNFAAQMMRTAHEIKSRGGYLDYWPVILAPATGDTTETSTNRTHYATFTSNLLNALNGFQAGGWFGWSQHSHRDIEMDAGSGSDFYLGPERNHAQHVRSLLNGRWWGWGSPTNPWDPKMFLTEGGARLNVVRDEWYVKKNRPLPTPAELRDKQAQLMQRNYVRILGGTESAGISMNTQYLVTSHWTYDTGLRDADTYAKEAEIY